ncbi:MAG TPA: hypothetical protein VMF08_23290 [Candidatus Sulfotelmatobacter sp.]|nr:hypothetical protein [Candidatus Sulfotelmatobacter sp.]
MKTFPEKKFSIFQRAEFLSAKDMIQRAVAISGLFLVVHLAGFREYTSILNGTIGSLTLGWDLSTILAVFYIALYLAFVIVVPVLLLAAAILMIWQRLIKNPFYESRRNPAPPHQAPDQLFHTRPLFERGDSNPVAD